MGDRPLEGTADGCAVFRVASHFWCVRVGDHAGAVFAGMIEIRVMAFDPARDQISRVPSQQKSDSRRRTDHRPAIILHANRGDDKHACGDGSGGEGEKQAQSVHSMPPFVICMMWEEGSALSGGGHTSVKFCLRDELSGAVCAGAMIGKSPPGALTQRRDRPHVMG